jgi:hypothetical protein
MHTGTIFTYSAAIHNVFSPQSDIVLVLKKNLDFLFEKSGKNKKVATNLDPFWESGRRTADMHFDSRMQSGAEELGEARYRRVSFDLEPGLQRARVAELSSALFTTKRNQKAVESGSLTKCFKTSKVLIQIVYTI